MSEFKDPLDEIIQRQKKALGKEEAQEPVVDIEDDVIEPVTEDEDIYGENDLENERLAQEAYEEEQRQKRLEEIHAAKSQPDVMMPPDEKDMNYHAAAIGYQTDKLEIVTGMINKVVAKYNLKQGGIPEEGDIRMRVMGELIDIYHETGEEITPRFEEMILQNWKLNDGTSAAEAIKAGREIGENNVTETPSQEVVNEEEKKPVEDKPVQINVDVKEDTPVTINLDSELLENFTTKREINVVVHRISDMNVDQTVVIENSDRKDIIKPYDPGINDVPLTIPMSAYRCVIRSITFLDFIQLAVPSSGNTADRELKEWSILYRHLKNASIGQFADFDDFLKMTKIEDKELLMWGLLVATADDEENLPITCGNPKCKHTHVITYNPRTIIHVDNAKIPKHYQKTHDVSVGKEALEHCMRVNRSVSRYKFPDSEIFVDIVKPSAYDYINTIIPKIRELAARFGSEDLSKLNMSDPEFYEFDILCTIAMYVKSMSIMKDGVEYKYTHFEEIEDIMRNSLSTRDSGVFMGIINSLRDEESPITFYIENVVCPKCGRKDEKVPIDNIAQTLLFQISQRLQSTAISLTEAEQN